MTCDKLQVLTRPWVLLELFWALKRGLPIVCVSIEGDEARRYDFDAAKAFLDTLATSLEAANPGARAVVEERLGQHGYAFDDLQRLVSKTVPNVISVSFRPDRSDNHVQATINDIVDKLARSRRTSVLESWVESL